MTSNDPLRPVQRDSSSAAPDYRLEEHASRPVAREDSSRADADRRVEAAPRSDRAPHADAPRSEARSRESQSQSQSQTPVETAPAGGGRTAGIWISLILGAIVLVLLLIFILQNNSPAVFEYMTWTFSLPLGVAMLLAAIAGALVMGLVGSVRIFQLGRTNKKLRRQLDTIQGALNRR